jgi:hypothetical protein
MFADKTCVIHSNPNNQTTIELLNNYAQLLADRWVPSVGVTRSWGNIGDSNVQVIIDNMINVCLNSLGSSSWLYYLKWC